MNQWATENATSEGGLPVALQGALLSLYGNYEKYYRLWEQNTEARARGITPPVFIVVCNNTNVSKLVFGFIACIRTPSPSGRGQGEGASADDLLNLIVEVTGEKRRSTSSLRLETSRSRARPSCRSITRGRG